MDRAKRLRLTAYREENASDRPLFDHLIIGAPAIMDALGLALSSKRTFWRLLEGMGCPVKLVDEFRPGKGGRGKVWIAERQALSQWLDARLSKEFTSPSRNIKEDLVWGRSAIMDLFHIPHSYDDERKPWEQVEAIIRDYRAPIAQIGKRWATRFSLLDAWFNVQLRGEG